MQTYTDYMIELHEDIQSQMKYEPLILGGSYSLPSMRGTDIYWESTPYGWDISISSEDTDFNSICKVSVQDLDKFTIAHLEYLIESMEEWNDMEPPLLVQWSERMREEIYPLISENVEDRFTTTQWTEYSEIKIITKKLLKDIYKLYKDVFEVGFNPNEFESMAIDSTNFMLAHLLDNQEAKTLDYNHVAKRIESLNQKYYALYDLQLKGFKSGYASTDKEHLISLGAERVRELSQGDMEPCDPNLNDSEVLYMYDYEVREVSKEDFEKILESDEVGLTTTVTL